MNIWDKIKGGLIVSCQAEGDDPFNNPSDIAKFAKAALMGGAVAIRSEGIDKIKAIKQSINLPVIGLLKSEFENGFVRITGSFKEVEQLMKIGCDIIAVDGTFRKRDSFSGPDFISEIKKQYSNIILMADIATAYEGEQCIKSGADCVSTTLSGYTPDTAAEISLPDFELVRRLSAIYNVPVIAEGRINSPDSAKKMLENGAWAVVVGTAITRPRVITSWYVNELNKYYGTTDKNFG